MCLLPVTGVRSSEVNMQGVCIKRISLMANVLHIDQPVQVLTKQDVIIADSTASAKLTLWEGNPNILNGGQSYQFKSVTVRFYKQEKISPFPKRFCYYTY